MRTARTVAAALLAAALLTVPACGETVPQADSPSDAPSATVRPSDSSPEPGSSSPTGSTTPDERPAPLEDGRHPAHVVAVDPAGRTVTVDVVQFLTGDAAASAAAEDGGEVPPPNDYWVRNQNDLLRTLAVTDDARVVTNTLTATETGDATADVEVTLDRLADLPGLTSALFWLTVVDGEVVACEEQYLP